MSFIHLSILISVFSNSWRSASLVTYVSAPYNSAGFIILLYNFALSLIDICLSQVTGVNSLHLYHATSTLVATSAWQLPVSVRVDPRYLNASVCFSWLLCLSTALMLSLSLLLTITSVFAVFTCSPLLSMQLCQFQTFSCKLFSLISCQKVVVPWKQVAAGNKFICFCNFGEWQRLLKDGCEGQPNWVVYFSKVREIGNNWLQDSRRKWKAFDHFLFGVSTKKLSYHCWPNVERKCKCVSKSVHWWNWFYH